MCNANYLFGGKCQKECDIYVFRSINLDTHLKKLRKSTLSAFDEKRRHIN